MPSPVPRPATLRPPSLRDYPQEHRVRRRPGRSSRAESSPARAAEEHLDLYDANVNGWLTQQPGRQILVPTLRPRGDGGMGIARAVVS
jgi:anti-sigma factor RsiW